MTSSKTKGINHSKDSNLESFACLWLDQNIDSTQDNRDTQTELRRIINHLRTFDDCDKCEKYIRKITREKVVLIVSGSFGQLVIPQIHDLSQLSAFYVFCQDKEVNEQWAKKYYKGNGVFDERSKLIAEVSEDQSVRIRVEDSASISVISSDVQSLQARNATFMWFQLFIEVLLHMHHKSTDRQELIDICKTSYKTNSYEMEIINEFEKHYQSENAIWWYTRESCFYRMMNKALRVQDFDMLFSLRFFITDIAKQIKHDYDKFIRTTDTRNLIRVYRGQAIGNDELQLMNNSIGEFLSMNSFLSTSRNRATALSFARSTPITSDSKRIIFEIDIDPRLQTKAFADISEQSFHCEEDEVLIMLGALFRIVKVIEDEKNELWIAYVSLASEDDFQLKKTFAYMKERIGDETDLDSLGKILIEMGEPEQAQKCYKRMIDDTKLTLGNAEAGFALACLDCEQGDESLAHFEEALKIRQSLLGEDHADVGECYSYMGTVYWCIQNNYKKGLVNLLKAIEIQEKTLPPDSLALARTYNNIATTYFFLQKHDMALTYYNKALDIREKVLPADHPDIASIYNNLGNLYEAKKEYAKAMKYYERALNSRRKTLPPDHPSITQTEENILELKAKLRQ
ncbi:hypothetical protein I4U23_026924 [Adineta vaga]|nr:hypothetical protein I4U23_026924 [Adineta vaga]